MKPIKLYWKSCLQAAKGKNQGFPSYAEKSQLDLRHFWTPDPFGVRNVLHQKWESSCGWVELKTKTNKRRSDRIFINHDGHAGAQCPFFSFFISSRNVGTEQKIAHYKLILSRQRASQFFIPRWTNRGSEDMNLHLCLYFIKFTVTSSFFQVSGVTKINR